MRPIRLHFILVAFCAAVCLVEGKVETVEGCGMTGFGKGAMTNRGIGGYFKYILGGKPVRSGEHPWMVSLQDKDGDHRCGATIINRDWVVSAAHCFKRSKKTSDYAIYVGALKLSSWDLGKGEVYQVRKIITHKYYDDKNKYNDIALVRTAKPLNINSSIGLVNGICLPPKNEEPTGEAIVAGWGDTQYMGTISDVLQYVETPLVPREKCGKFYPRENIPETIVCAGGELGKDSCQGDSGGPLMQLNSEGRYTLIGIVSSGRGCGAGTPGQYTKVSAFIDWMDANMIV